MSIDDDYDDDDGDGDGDEASQHIENNVSNDMAVCRCTHSAHLVVVGAFLLNFDGL